MKMRIHMNSSRVLPILFLVLCFYSGPSSAIPVDDLYVAKVLVTDEGSSQLVRAGGVEVRNDLQDGPLDRER